MYHTPACTKGYTRSELFSESNTTCLITVYKKYIAQLAEHFTIAPDEVLTRCIPRKIPPNCIKYIVPNRSDTYIYTQQSEIIHDTHEWMMHDYHP